MSGHYCNGKLVDIVSRSYMGGNSLTFRGRRFSPSSGDRTEFNSQNHNLDFNEPFWDQCSLWANNMRWHFDRNSPYSDGTLLIDWFGDVGTKACHRSTSSHNRARGFDLCQIRFSNGWVMDSNWSHQAGEFHARRYLGVAANLRRYFGTVLTAWYNSAHRDHIHFDDYSSPVSAISTNKRSDTTLIQAACNLLNGENLGIDGNWGNLTESAYLRLLRAFNLDCRNPKSSANDARSLCYYIMRNGIANESTPGVRSRSC